jgi:60 kDa SS-A/Ro ribonucleoprotein
MATRYVQHVSPRQTPQSQPIPGQPMVPNSAGGYAFAVDDWTRLHRFLVLGAEGGSYYASERKLTVENAGAVKRCLDADAARTVETIAALSESGRAPKNDPAVFALALAASHKAPDGTYPAAPLAWAALSRVCRIGTHLFQFVAAIDELRGWGRGAKRGVAKWYEAMPVERLAYQLAKYQRRGGWSHRDVLRLSGPRADDPARAACYRYAVAGLDGLGVRSFARSKGGPTVEYPSHDGHLPAFLAAVERAKTADRATLVRLIREANLPRECVPTEHLNAPEVWEALLEKMPLTAMIRSLGKLSAVGLLTPLSPAARAVCDRLGDAESLRRSRVHPIALLLAQSVYARGKGEKGSLAWTPVQPVVDALDRAFDLAFGNVEPAGKRTLIGLDVSGSMSCGQVAGTSLTPREAAAAMALLIARTEPAYHCMAFATEPTELQFAATATLRSVVAHTSQMAFGGTDCSLPMRYAMDRKLEVDTFVVLTDSETWAGPVHPCQALNDYRQRTGIPARLAVVGMVSNGFSIADPNDAGMIDFVGFDTATPAVLADFSAGWRSTPRGAEDPAE